MAVGEQGRRNSESAAAHFVVMAVVQGLQVFENGPCQAVREDLLWKAAGHYPLRSGRTQSPWFLQPHSDRHIDN